MFKITVVEAASSRGVVAKGSRKIKGSSLVYDWEIEAFDNGEYQLYINGDNEGIDFKSVKECREYIRNLVRDTEMMIENDKPTGRKGK